MSDCIFCKIINGEIPCNKVYENETVLAFHDINPVAPVHVLVIPKQHIESILTLDASNAAVNAELFKVINIIATKLGIDKDGFRVIANVGVNGGQTVPHLHYHILGGKIFNDL